MGLNMRGATVCFLVVVPYINLTEMPSPFLFNHNSTPPSPVSFTLWAYGFSLFFTWVSYPYLNMKKLHSETKGNRIGGNIRLDNSFLE